NFFKHEGSFNAKIPENIWPEAFIRDVESRIWLTYRTGFFPIAKSVDGPSPLTSSLGTFLRSGSINDINHVGFTSDVGWGCMIRTSQSLLANTFLNLLVGRDWRYNKNEQDEQDEQGEQDGDDTHKRIISWFVDAPSAPFSIHNFVDKGITYSGKKAGEWFGPSAAARSIQVLCDDYKECGLKVYLSEDSGDIYEDELMNLLENENGTVNPVLILCGVRLGVENVNPIYWDALKKTLAIPQSVGIAGGRPSSSHYFFGFQGDYLFYLDPHLPQKPLQIPSSYIENQDPQHKENESVQERKEEIEVETQNEAAQNFDESLETSNYIEVLSNLDIPSVHTTRLRKLHLNQMDPSMLIGFLIKDKKDYEDWKNSLQSNDLHYKIVHISQTNNSALLEMRQPSISIVDMEDDEDEFVDLGLNPRTASEANIQSEGNEENSNLNSKKSQAAHHVSAQETCSFPHENVSNHSEEEYEAPVEVGNNDDSLVILEREEEKDRGNFTFDDEKDSSIIQKSDIKENYEKINKKDYESINEPAVVVDHHDLSNLNLDESIIHYTEEKEVKEPSGDYSKEPSKSPLSIGKGNTNKDEIEDSLEDDSENEDFKSSKNGKDFFGTASKFEHDHNSKPFKADAEPQEGGNIEVFNE
ncbi:hypothetical protein PACTADRAFT_51451, partial [Pachysolen tannophilus NRRL Y-2460]